MTRSRLRSAAWLLPVAVALLAHGASIGGGFTVDDGPDIVDHPVVSGDAAPWEVHHYNYMGEPVGTGTNTIRPLATLLFAAEWQLWGARPALFHAVSVLLFCVLVLLVQRYARVLVGPGPALAVAALFASLAIHVDAVGLVANSAEVLSLALGVLALLAAARGRPVVAGVALLAALLAKESSIGVPLVAAAQVLLMTGRGTPERRRGALAVAALLGAAALYLVARAALLDFDVEGNVLQADNPLLDAPPGARLWMPFVLLGRYVALTLAPLSLSFDYTYNQIPAAADLADPHGWLGVALVLGAAAVTALALRRRAAVPVVIAVGFAASYGLFSNTLFLNVTIFAERLFLAPSLWLCLAAVCAAQRLLAREPSARRALIALCGTIVVSQVALAAVRSSETRSNLSLFAAQVVTAPDSMKGRLYYGRALAAEGAAEEALWQVAIAYDARLAFPGPWRAPREVEDLPVRERLRRLPQLVAPDMPAADYWRTLRPVAVRFAGRQVLPIIDRLASGR